MNFEWLVDRKKHAKPLDSLKVLKKNPRNWMVPWVLQRWSGGVNNGQYTIIGIPAALDVLKLAGKRVQNGGHFWSDIIFNAQWTFETMPPTASGRRYHSGQRRQSWWWHWRRCKWTWRERSAESGRSWSSLLYVMKSQMYTTRLGSRMTL